MTRTNSTMISLSTQAPDFTLFDVISEKMISLQELGSEVGTIVVFICDHCPYVKHIQIKLVECANTYMRQGFNFVAINSNDPLQYPEDAPPHMKLTAKQFGYPFAYLFDETQEVAKAYHAACTPDFYVFDKQLQCVYRGQFDDSRPFNDLPVTGKDLTDALDAMLTHQPINPEQKPSLGCNIKWKYC